LLVGPNAETTTSAPTSNWVLAVESACQHLATLQASPHGGSQFITVNASGQSLSYRYHQHVQAMLDRHQITDPSGLVIEATESAQLVATGRIIRTFHSLKELGVQLALDDFGTGYASIKLLQDLPLNIVKTDRSFLPHTHNADNSPEFFQTMLHLIALTGAQTCIEGVETPEQHQWLSSLTDVTYLQGFLLGEPAPIQTTS